MNPPILNALVVEDDRSWQQILSEILADSGLTVQVVSSLEEAIAALKAKPHRLAVVDLSLSPNDHNNYDGLRVLDAVRHLDPNCRSLLLTGFATVELAVTALAEYGAFTFLRKENFNRAQFNEILNRALSSAPNLPSEQFPAPAASRPLPKPGTASRTPASPTPVEKALVVEDDAGWRSILEELLLDSGFQVRACASFGEALGAMRREKFRLAVIDLSLKAGALWGDKPENSADLEGYQLLSNARAANLPTIVVSGIASTQNIQRAYAEQGIFAYLEKQAFERATFLRTVQEARTARQPANSELALLTEREREVLDLLAKGMTNKEIAEKLVITTNTVKRHLKAIFEKLEVHTRSAAAAKAVGEK